MAEKEIFINSQSEMPTLEDWEKMGSPIVWVPYKTIYLNRLTHRKTIKVWIDMAYSKLRIDVNGHVETGSDIVQCGEFILLGEEYGYKEPMVFRRVGR